MEHEIKGRLSGQGSAGGVKRKENVLGVWKWSKYDNI
jgi:hypothetical protein